MSNRKLKYLILVFLLLLVIILGSVIFFSKNRDLKVVFMDVGQGDAILISEGSNQVLIDSGKSGQVILEKLGKHIPFWDRKIEAVVITHPDQDHVGGFADIFKSYEIETVLKTNAKNNSKTFEILNEYIVSEKSEVIEVKKGINLQFPSGAKIETIYPNFSVTESSEDTNASSVVSILNAGEDRFIFTGDFPGEKEAETLIPDIDADILKVSHHGSKYSTTDDFLKKVSPKDAVISVGKNPYGHPAEETISRLKSNGVKILRTDESGDIIYICKKLAGSCTFYNPP